MLQATFTLVSVLCRFWVWKAWEHSLFSTLFQQTPCSLCCLQFTHVSIFFCLPFPPTPAYSSRILIFSYSVSYSPPPQARNRRQFRAPEILSTSTMSTCKGKRWQYWLIYSHILSKVPCQRLSLITFTKTLILYITKSESNNCFIRWTKNRKSCFSFLTDSK